jgi:hypothetical protein
VVRPVTNEDAGPTLERLRLDDCRSAIAHFKCPKSIEFRGDLPRRDAGKLYKRLLEAQYLAKENAMSKSRQRNPNDKAKSGETRKKSAEKPAESAPAPDDERIAIPTPIEPGDQNAQPT